MNVRHALAIPLLFSALLSGCSSTGDISGETVASAEVANPDEVTCKSVVKTGTRIGSRICKTNRAWAVTSSSGRGLAEGIQRTSAHTQGLEGN